MALKKQANAEGVQATAAWIESFLALLEASKQRLPSTRCISHEVLVDLVRESRDAIDSPVLRKHTGARLISLLEDSAIVRQLPLEQGAAKKVARLYTVGLNLKAAAIPPAELLQAHITRGVLCYFTAIELHALSTQPAPHYHIAIPRISATTRSTLPNQEHISSDGQLPLGTTQFILEGTTFYSTLRDSSHLLGTQRRQLNPYCIVNVTNLEQTLLDCLHRPRSAGGPAVVFEAWREGFQRTTAGKISALAIRIGDNTLLRRAGYMIEQYRPDIKVLSKIKDAVGKPDMRRQLPTLLPGVPYQHVNDTWGLRTP